MAESGPGSRMFGFLNEKSRISLVFLGFLFFRTLRRLGNGSTRTQAQCQDYKKSHTMFLKLISHDRPPIAKAYKLKSRMCKSKKGKKYNYNLTKSDSNNPFYQ
ncbi:hypothetical protein EBS67_12875 [bacterium]|nr:hypothetical protein [bacterium]